MNVLNEAFRVLEVEAKAILRLKETLNEDFEKAVEQIVNCKGKVILSGIGKSGHIATKISSTFSSTGTPSIFVHPAEASHGDMGIIEERDVLIMISNGGNSIELVDMIGYANRKNIPLIAFTSKPDSQLGQAARWILDISVEEEACPLGLAPTTSTTVSLALGDALAMSVLKKRGFKKEDYAEFHPGGSLGRRLLTRVKDVMHSEESLPLVLPRTPMKEVLSKMTAKEVRGVAGVISEHDGKLLGIITDGDIRRRLDRSENPLMEQAEEIMSTSPKTIKSSELAEKALFMMEQFQIQTLFVVGEDDANGKPIGLLHLQDLLKAKIR